MITFNSSVDITKLFPFSEHDRVNEVDTDVNLIYYGMRVGKYLAMNPLRLTYMLLP